MGRDEYANATEYRRWRDRAEAHFHHGSALLTGTDLSRASEWWFGLANQPVTIADSGTPRWRPLARWAERYEAPESESDAVRYPKVLTLLLQTLAVRQRQERKERTKTRLLVSLSIASTLLCIVIGAQSVSAYKASLWRQATSFWQSLTFEDGVSAKEKEALTRLSRAPDTVQKVFIGELFADGAYPVHFNRHPEMIAAAAVGTNLTMRDTIVADLRPTQPGNHADASQRLARSLLLAQLDSPVDDFDSLGLTEVDPSEPALDVLVQGLQRGTLTLTPAQADQLRRSLLISVTETTFSPSFTRAYGALVDLLPADSAFDLQLDELTKNIDSDADRMLRATLVSTSKRLTADQATVAARKVIDGIQHVGDPDQLDAMRETLAALAEKLTPEQQADIAHTEASVFLSVKDVSRQRALAQGLAVSIGAASPERLRPLLVEALDRIKAGTNQLGAMEFVRALSQVASPTKPWQPRLTPRQGEVQKERSILVLAYRVEAARISGATLSDKDSLDIASKLVGRLHAGVNDDGSLAALTLNRVRPQLPADAIAAFGNKLLKDLKSDDGRSPRGNALACGILALGVSLDVDQAKLIAVRLAARRPVANLLFGLQSGRQSLRECFSFTSEKVALLLVNQLFPRKANSSLANVEFLLPGSPGELLPVAMPVLAPKLSASDADRLLGIAFFHDADPESPTSPIEVDDLSVRALDLSSRSAANVILPLIEQLDGQKANVRAASLFRAIIDQREAGVARADGSQRPLAGTRRLSDALTHAGPHADSDFFSSVQKRLLYRSQFAALAARLDPPDARTLALNLLEQIRGTNDAPLTEMLSRGLAAALNRLTPADSEAVSKLLLAQIRTTSEPFKLEAYGPALAALATKLSPETLSSADYFYSLRIPLFPRDKLADAVRTQFSDAPPSKEGFWPFISWAQRRFPELELNQTSWRPGVLIREFVQRCCTRQAEHT